MDLILNSKLTKADIKSVSDQAIERILSGEADPLKIEVQLKIMEEIIKAIRKNENVKVCLLAEADQYPGKSFSHAGALITKTQKTTYDYSGDSEWADLDDKKKTRESFLKNLITEVVEPDTGLIIKPADFKVTQYLKIELEK